ncbi:MAG TPA: hypothetical protein VFM55_20880 [Micromonosporaceae bacterium]|nr:hypothetical protein [Micromonosporaceae bacterium]
MLLATDPDAGLARRAVADATRLARDPPGRLSSTSSRPPGMVQRRTVLLRTRMVIYFVAEL